jgi:hypothetical protein
MSTGSLDLGDAALLRMFMECALTHAQWDHTAHLRVAWLHIRDHGRDASIDLLRTRINALNAAHNVPDLPTRGYHESITVAWAHVIASRLADDVDSRSFLLRNADLQDKRYLARFYTPDRLMSPEAKAGFVEPDLAPLP